MNDIPHPVYNFLADYSDNELGPWDGIDPDPLSVTPVDWEFLGESIRFPLGVGASCLTANANWIRYFAGHGYNVLTYKTVRSEARNPYPYPQWVFLEDRDPWLDLSVVSHVRGGIDFWPKDMTRISTANSVGMPSTHPDEWTKDIGACREMLARGQLLIVSVVGSDMRSPTGLANDFAHVAKRAGDAGATIIEVNLSCPNTFAAGKSMSPICEDAEAAAAIVGAVRKALPPTVRIVAKLSALRTPALDAVVRSIGKNVDAISGINTNTVQLR
ncbi:MAG: hypothetical protein M0T79_10545 [Actinomycetota bacterium]|nr:hypothetical protein [Actinomycetota bacterium]